ncbi:MAG: hypothetical protein WC197_05380 [Candidatus Gastranaerophilaceae bacterium]
MRIDFNNIANAINIIAKSVEGQGSQPSAPNSTVFAETFAHLSKNTGFQQVVKLQVLNNYQINLLLRDLMSLPKEWSDFLTLVANNNGSAKLALEMLLLQNPEIDLKNIAMLLSQNSSKMLDKLIKLTTLTGTASQGIEQFRDIINIGTTMFANVSADKIELLRNTLQLYLPWLPLDNPDLKLLEELKKEFNTKNGKTGETLFFITTKTIGQFKISIISGEKTHEIDIVNLTAEKDEEIEKQLKKKIKDECSKITVELNFTYKSSLTENIKEQEKQLYIINNDNSLISLILLQLVSKAIFETDEKTVLLKTRKNKIDGNSTP